LQNLLKAEARICKCSGKDECLQSCRECDIIIISGNDYLEVASEIPEDCIALISED